MSSCKCFIGFLFASTILVLVSGQKYSNICKSVTVRTIGDLQKLQNCNVVAGHVKITQMEFTPESLDTLKPLDIEEISEYLLIYRVSGLDSLERIFPKLLVIRGIKLLYDQYGLVVHENRHLENIGLLSLLRILRGSVRIESNPSLCYAHTINWVSILGNVTKKYHYELKYNKPVNYCPLCYGYNPTEKERHQQCWSLGKQQQLPLADFSYPCLTDCPSKKCNKKGKCCSGNCLTSCSDDSCRYCTNLINGKKCVKTCIPNLLAFGRQCVSDCHSYGLIRLGAECVEKCPKFYRPVKRGLETSCDLSCIGNFTMKSSEDFEGFADCTTLQGSLTIELTDISKSNIHDLDTAFGKLSEITGYLKIIRSPQLVSLHFLCNLQTIAGNFLADDIYALYVVDNHHLEELWNSHQRVSIPKGRIYFHLNPRLCYGKIAELQYHMKESNITITDVSLNSNGELGLCESIISALNATVEDFNANEVRIKLDYLSPEALSPLIGYIYYYRESPKRNISKYDSRHGCGLDKWFMDVSSGKQVRHVLENLKPNTQYAYFVKTFAITDYHYQVDATSDVQYFRTSPAKPSRLKKIYYRSLSENEIEIHWWPPRMPNGIIEKYILTYEAAESANHTIETTHPIRTPQQQKVLDVCRCPKIDAENSGPMPLYEDYYHPEQIVYDEALYNFIYVPSKNKNATKSSQSYIELMESFDRVHEELLNSSIKEQDYGKDDFEISTLLPLCNETQPSTSYKQEHQCEELEEIAVNYTLPGDTHSFTLKDLRPHTTYRISLRACVEDMDNGCGPETFIWAETVSKRLGIILENLKLTAAASNGF